MVLKRALASMAGLITLLAASESVAGSNTYGLGVEGFRDWYHEPSLDVTDTTDYGSLTGYFEHQFARKTFMALDLRGSYGTDDYSSPSGHLSGVPEWEFEGRLRFGITMDKWGGSLSPYTGIGTRYYQYDGKGYTTDLGAQAYDRRINQVYIPLGASWSYAMDNGWTLTPQLEGDYMFWGNVDTRLTNVTNGPIQFLNVSDNAQHEGFGVRSEVMVGKTMGNYTLQAGPFVRYWWVAKSNTNTYYDVNTGLPSANVWEPENNRLQVGVAARVLF